jgi:hypothetical protein
MNANIDIEKARLELVAKQLRKLMKELDSLLRGNNSLSEPLQTSALRQLPLPFADSKSHEIKS